MSSHKQTISGLVNLRMAITGITLLFGIIGVSSVSSSQEPESLRGNTPILDNPTPPRLTDFPRETQKYQPSYVGQPPRIPHDIRGYEISANHNACLACHSWENARKFKATPIGVSHYRDRDGNMLADVSPNRYSCTQCHVAQKNAPPLRKNLFEPLESVTP